MMLILLFEDCCVNYCLAWPLRGGKLIIKASNTWLDVVI